jgi:hypothetical protein
MGEGAGQGGCGMSEGPSGYLIEKVLGAWNATRHRLADIDAEEADEPDLVSAMTKANDKVSWVQTWLVRAEREAKRFVEVVKAERADLAVRQKRFEARQEQLRAGLVASIQIAVEPDATGKRTIELPQATVTLTPGKGRVLQVTDEAQIPDRFFAMEMREVRTLMTNELAAALAECIDGETGEVLPGEKIDGASLIPAPPKLMIRSR